MDFQKSKERQLGMHDRSDIGKWDLKIVKLCRKINQNPDYYTTSSCAGRVVLIKSEEKKRSGLFVYRTHNRLTFKEIKRELKKSEKEKGIILFKQEPVILHVACISIESAQKMLDKAKFVGWKNSGIMASNERVVLEMRSTEKLELPIMNKGKILVDDNYLRLLIKEANRRLDRTWEKINKLGRLV